MHEKIREGFDVFLHDGEKSFGAVHVRYEKPNWWSISRMPEISKSRSAR